LAFYVYLFIAEHIVWQNGGSDLNVNFDISTSCPLLFDYICQLTLGEVLSSC